MKVIFLEGQNEKLQDILEKLGCEVLIAENKAEDFIEEWQNDNNVKVFEYSEFSPEVDHICKGLNLYTDAYKFIADNFTQNQMNDLTFSEVEYVKGLNKPELFNKIYISSRLNDDRVDAMTQRINRTESGRALRGWDPNYQRERN